MVPESVADPLGYYLNNTSNARTLVEAAVRRGVKNFIFSSTAAVYGEASSEPVSEEAPLAPIPPYGRSKLMVEWMLEDAARGTLAITSIEQRDYPVLMGLTLMTATLVLLSNLIADILYAYADPRIRYS